VTSDGARREAKASHYRDAGGFALVITPLAPLMLRGEGGRDGIATGLRPSQ